MSLNSTRYLVYYYRSKMEKDLVHGDCVDYGEFGAIQRFLFQGLE